MVSPGRRVTCLTVPKLRLDQVAIPIAETTRKSGGFTKHASSWGASSRLVAPAAPSPGRLAFVSVEGAPGGGGAAAVVPSVGALVLALVGLHEDSLAAASLGPLNHGIEQHPADALAPSLRKHADQAQQPGS